MPHTWTKRLLILGVYIPICPPRRYAPGISPEGGHLICNQVVYRMVTVNHVRCVYSNTLLTYSYVFVTSLLRTY